MLIVFESMYGNTAAIARAIAEGAAGASAEVSVRGVDDATVEDALACDLLVVGGPTHAHGMTRASTRKTALNDTKNVYEDPTVGEGLRGWLDRLDGQGHAATAFDTRIDASPTLTGAASKGIARKLVHRGFRLAVDRESFLVTKQNTLVDGELARAAAWGTALATQAAVAV